MVVESSSAYEQVIEMHLLTIEMVRNKNQHVLFIILSWNSLTISIVTWLQIFCNISTSCEKSSSLDVFNAF